MERIVFFPAMFLLVLSAAATGSGVGARQMDALRWLMKAKGRGSVDVRDWDGFEDSHLEGLREINRAVGSSNLEGMRERDRIIRLPGQPEVDFAQYGGYVTVDEEAGRALFYYLAEAVGENSQSKPLLLWINGGPACSSLGLGAFQELGPFRVGSDGKTLFRNRYSWNAGKLVSDFPLLQTENRGFWVQSEKNSSIYNFIIIQESTRNYNHRSSHSQSWLMLNWFITITMRNTHTHTHIKLSWELYHQSKILLSASEVANVLFLETPAGTGFSYLNRTSDYNNIGDQRMALDSYIFLVNWLERFPEYKGSDFYIAGESYAGHSVTQLALAILQHNRLHKNKTEINLKGITIGNPVIDDESEKEGNYDFFWSHALSSDESITAIHKYCLAPNTTDNFDKCDLARTDADLTSGEVDPYNIYAPPCRSHKLTSKPKRINFEQLDPCVEDYTTHYLNLPDVQTALHANVTNLSFPWGICSDVIHLSWKDSPSSILPLIKELMAKAIRVWVYSGDVDGVISVTGTRYSLSKLNLPVKTAWYPWYSNKEVGGFTFVYKGDLTFATIRGAGHEVPSYQPARALTYIKYFLLGQLLPASSD